MERNNYCKDTGLKDISNTVVFEEDILELSDTLKRIHKSRYGVVECKCDADFEWMVLCANGNVIPLKEVAKESRVVGTFLNDAERYLTALVKRRIIGW